MKRAVVFAGQGSQFTNMGKDFLTDELVKKANEILGYDVLEILENKNNELNDTYYTQPMIALVSIAIYDKYQEFFLSDAFLGFSLGEYTALYAAGIYSLEDILRIVKTRSFLMQEASLKKPGKMAAVINLSDDIIKETCEKYNCDNEVLVVANYNARNQIVISGTENMIKKVSEELKLKGAKRVIELNVSGAFHSPLMKEAGIKLREYLETIDRKKAIKPIYLNTTANIHKDTELLTRLEEQIQSPVHFYQSIERMIEDGYTSFTEIGPGTVLSQLIKKNYQNVSVNNIQKIEDLEQMKGMKQDDN